MSPDISGNSLILRELCSEAIRLARMLYQLMPDEAEVAGLLGLMLLHDSGRDARVDLEGRIVLLEDQDRSRWDRAQIVEGLDLSRRSIAISSGAYGLQSAICCRARRC
jgi:RNA polymerase sigma-70 factor, ECF subfamily